MNNKILTLAALGFVFASCGNQTQAPVIEEAAPIKQVSIITAAKQNVPQNTTYSSTIQPKAINNIVSQTAGRIRELNVEIGDFVKEGQVLAEMDRVSLEQAALKLNNDKKDFERIKALHNEGGISKADYESMELALQVSMSSYENLLENTVLRAPISGVITARNYDKGDMYAMSTPIYTLQQITPVKLLVAVSESDYTKIKKGDSATLVVDAIPDKTFYGKIVRLHPVMDPASHSFNAEIEVENAYKTLRPGMYARVTINKGINNSIVVPDSAVLKQQGSGVKTVFVLNSDGTVSQKVVTLGLHFESSYEILSGLDEGDKVVIKGNNSLKSGEKVEVAR